MKEKKFYLWKAQKGALVEEVFDKEPGYFGWIQNADFPLYTKKSINGN